MIKVCPICKKEFKTYRSKRVYCSHKCVCEGNRVNSDVIKNVGVGIKTENKYSTKHFRKREVMRAITRGFKKGACELCGNTDSKLFLHHIVPLRLGGKSIKRNCITLCKRCHNIVHDRVSSILLKYFEDKQDELYGLLKETVDEKYFISFVEEGIFSQKYKGYVGGRIEVYGRNSDFAIEEVRFLTKKKSWNKFRDKWDFRNITEEELTKIKTIVKDRYYNL